jgi:hypothetical protein
MTKLAVRHRRAATGDATNAAASTCATGRHDLDHLQWPTGRTPCETDGIQPMLRVGFPNPTPWGINPTPSRVVTAPERRATFESVTGRERPTRLAEEDGNGDLHNRAHTR